MKLIKASTKAIKFAIKNWHYSKSVPSVSIAYSVFDNSNVFCGVICFGHGATMNIAKPFGLTNGQCVELVRVALNGKQSSTTKAVSIALRLLKKDAPLVKLIVSYADSEQGHKGIIYQGGNWYFIGSSTDRNIIVNGKRQHRRTLGSLYGTNSIIKMKAMGLNVGERIFTLPKYKYIYPLDKKLIPMCKAMAKPYPKNAAVAHKGERRDTNPEGAFDSTAPLKENP
jgi:hypothetical protein